MSIKISTRSIVESKMPQTASWTNNGQQKYYEAADKLINLGMSPDEAIDFLCDLYWATFEEIDA